MCLANKREELVTVPYPSSPQEDAHEMEQPKDRGYAYAEEEGYQQGARPKQDVLRQRYSGASRARSPRQQAAAIVQVHASTTSTSSTTTNQDPNRITPVADVDTVG